MTWFLIILLSAVIIGVALYIRKNKDDQLIATGKIIKRSGSFYEEEEIFSTTADYENLKIIFSKLDMSEMKVTVYPDLEGKRIILFKSGFAWNAVLRDLGVKNGKNTLSFSFAKWKKKDGSLININSMNMLETHVEKAILSLDPAAQVEVHKMQLDIKTKIL